MRRTRCWSSPGRRCGLLSRWRRGFTCRTARGTGWKGRAGPGAGGVVRIAAAGSPARGARPIGGVGRPAGGEAGAVGCPAASPAGPVAVFAGYYGAVPMAESFQSGPSKSPADERDEDRIARLAGQVEMLRKRSHDSAGELQQVVLALAEIKLNLATQDKTLDRLEHAVRRQRVAGPAAPHGPGRAVAGRLRPRPLARRGRGGVAAGQGDPRDRCALNSGPGWGSPGPETLPDRVRRPALQPVVRSTQTAMNGDERR